jgi:hypothetical protein
MKKTAAVLYVKHRKNYGGSFGISGRTWDWRSLKRRDATRPGFPRSWKRTVPSVRVSFISQLGTSRTKHWDRRSTVHGRSRSEKHSTFRVIPLAADASAHFIGNDERIFAAMFGAR